MVSKYTRGFYGTTPPGVGQRGHGVGKVDLPKFGPIIGEAGSPRKINSKTKQKAKIEVSPSKAVSPSKEERPRLKGKITIPLSKGARSKLEAKWRRQWRIMKKDSA
jgi:hypothetical protein